MSAFFYGALLLVGLVLLTVTAVRVLVGGLDAGGDRPATPPQTSNARRILEERYAAGELSTEEYQHRLRVLERGGA